MPKIFIVKTDGIDEHTFKKLLTLLPEAERKRILSKSNKNSRKNSLIAVFLVRYALKITFDVPFKEAEIFRDKYGKPYLKGRNDIHFSISHSSDIVACVASDKPVGIDIQKIKPVSLGVIRRTCSENEFEQFANSLEPVSSFIYMWTRKEAVLKKKGTGILDKDIKNCLENEKIFSTQYQNYWISCTI